MKLIEPSVEILEQSSGLNGIYKQIELAGRTCYKSEENMTDDSAKGFVDRMIKSGHNAMLEHGTVYLKYPAYRDGWINKYFSNKYSKVKYIEPKLIDENDYYLVTTNYRVLVENNWLDDLQYLCEPTEYHEKRITTKFIMDRIGSQSFCRHRVFSFAQESTRYCNYSKDKFGNELTFIIPSNTKILPFDCEPNVMSQNQILLAKDTDSSLNYLQALQSCELEYFQLLNKGWKPQEARSILPNCLKTELVMTGFESDWEGFFKLRCNKTAHPDMQVLANKLKELM